MQSAGDRQDRSRGSGAHSRCSAPELEKHVQDRDRLAGYDKSSKQRKAESLISRATKLRSSLSPTSGASRKPSNSEGLEENPTSCRGGGPAASPRGDLPEPSVHKPLGQGDVSRTPPAGIVTGTRLAACSRAE